MKEKRSVKLLIFCVGLCQLCGLLGAFFTTPAIPGWYASLQKPAFNPPNAVFGPVWTILYALMGAALYLVIRAEGPEALRRKAILLFGVQLALNTAWSWLFFGLKNPGLAFADIVLLWAAILASSVYFRRLSRPAFWMFLPYLLWVSFAMLLNFEIWRLNS